MMKTINNIHVGSRITVNMCGKLVHDVKVLEVDTYNEMVLCEFPGINVWVYNDEIRWILG